ncbi:hypothetical protein [Methylobacterium isbiliense]|jgi:hypothetical protein|uniref:Uncharacterized protein n=1 Tax=Methylobacterium isbiliense TaxID=315478 RepID=A0ABQ4SJK7_9HYPH|nr:hypothetical protein [Methylobacterium isbiliense]MDN3627880.1 hypothetical protein [Methylobacterium isbiliense]GJE03357.1 hypothetical protein GMJLKIPL_5311 [Methylobacterium isbiliense]
MQAAIDVLTTIGRDTSGAEQTLAVIARSLADPYALRLATAARIAA